MEVLSSNMSHYCIKCNNLMTSPIQTECGDRFCRKCFEESQTPCMTCGSDYSSHRIFIDKFIEREISCIKFKCPNSDCKELVTNQTKQEHSQNCIYRKVKCNLCIEFVKFKDLESHKTEMCFNFEIPCKFCKMCDTRSNMENIHLNAKSDMKNICRKWIGVCPLCNTTIRNEFMIHHLIKCDNRIISCKFEEYNCNFKGNKQDLIDHYNICKDDHIELLLINNKTQQINHKLEHKDLEKINENLSNQVNDLSMKSAKLEAQLLVLMNELNQIKNNFTLSKQNSSTICSATERPPIFASDSFLWVIDSIQEKLNRARNGGESIVKSSAFYMGSPGYKIYLKIYLNGDGSGLGQYLSLYFVICPGDFDSMLSWPYTTRLTFDIVKGPNNKPSNSFKTSLKPNINDLCYNKPSNNQDNAGSGLPKFIKISDILSNSDLTFNNQLKIKMMF